MITLPIHVTRDMKETQIRAEPLPEIIAAINITRVVDSDDLFQLPQRMHWKTTAGLRHIRLEDNQRDGSVLPTKLKETKTKGSHPIQFDPE